MIVEESYIDNLKEDLEESKQLLKEAVNFMNLVPNNTITIHGEISDDDTDFKDCINHYELCSKIDKFLKEK